VQAYKVIEAEIVNDQVFSQFIYKIIPDKVHMWTFKKQLNTQMALSGAPLLRP
jgi:transformation/transcription domain-associated protein